MKINSGNDIKKKREQLGLTQKQLASCIGVSPVMVSLWECGKRTLPDERYAQIMSLSVRNSSGGTTISTKKRDEEDTTVRVVRVSYKVETLSQVIEKARYFGEVVLQDGDELYQIKKIGAYAEGEFTGHHHVLIAEAGSEIVGDRTQFTVKGKAKLVHPEHGTIEFTSGNYVVSMEREYDYINETLTAVRD